jgi:hypothetical protein
LFKACRSFRFRKNFGTSGILLAAGFLGLSNFYGCGINVSLFWVEKAKLQHYDGIG